MTEDDVDRHPDLIEQLLGQTVRAMGLHRPIPLPSGGTASLSEMLALAELDRAAPLAQQDLADRLRLEKSSTSRLVEGMARRGWLVRERNPANRRYYEIDLTEPGRRLARELFATVRTHHEAMLDAMTPAERDALRVGLGALARASQHTGTLADPPPS